MTDRHEIPVGRSHHPAADECSHRGLTALRQRNAPVAVYDVTARSRPTEGPDTTATLPEASAAIRAAWPALSMPAERPPAVHSTGSVVAATAGLAVNGCIAREMMQAAKKRPRTVMRFIVEFMILFIVLLPLLLEVFPLVATSAWMLPVIISDAPGQNAVDQVNI